MNGTINCPVCGKADIPQVLGATVRTDGGHYRLQCMECWDRALTLETEIGDCRRKFASNLNCLTPGWQR